MTFKIDNLRPFRGKAHDPIVATGGENFTVSDRHRIGQGILTIESMNPTVSQDQCGSLRHNVLLQEAGSVFL